jgi:hypothetical protein
VWHCSKRLQTLSKLDQLHEKQEAMFVSLYSSEYIRETIDSYTFEKERAEVMVKDYNLRQLLKKSSDVTRNQSQ